MELGACSCTACPWKCHFTLPLILITSSIKAILSNHKLCSSASRWQNGKWKMAEETNRNHYSARWFCKTGRCGETLDQIPNVLVVSCWWFYHLFRLQGSFSEFFAKSQGDFMQLVFVQGLYWMSTQFLVVCIEKTMGKKTQLSLHLLRIGGGLKFWQDQHWSGLASKIFCWISAESL